MALVDFAEAYRPVQSSVARVFQAVAKRVAARRAARAKREALERLLLASEHLLADVGTTREQLVELIESERE